MKMMFHRIASVLLVAALVLVGGAAPFTHVPRMNRRPRQLVGSCERSVGELGHLHSQAAGTNTLVGDRHHHLSVTPTTGAVTHPSVRVGATPALVGFVMAGIVPDLLPGQPVPVAVNTRPNLQPRVVLPTRAPPV